MTIKKQQIHSALSHVIHPVLGKDLVTLDLVRDVIVQEKFITFTIELPEENPKIERKIKELSEAAIRRYVAEDAVLDLQVKINPFRQKEVEDKGVEHIESGANPMNMSEPNADNYTPPTTIEQVTYEEMPELLQHFIDEHKECIGELDLFEETLIQFKESQWVMDVKLNKAFSRFFTFMDNKILDHNRREEESLFPLLHRRLIESGEHSKFESYISNGDQRTAVEIMEDEHVKFIQLSTLSFNFLGLSSRLPDLRSQSMVADLAFEQGVQLVEMLRLHIQREDKTLFPLACHLISDEEFVELSSNLDKTEA